MGFDLKLWHKVLVLVAAPLVFEVVFISILINRLSQVEAQARALSHSRAVIAGADDMRRVWEQAINSLFLYVTTSSDASRGSFIEAMDELPRDWQILKELTKDDPNQTALCFRMSESNAEDLRIFHELKGRMDHHETFSSLSTLSGLRKKARMLSQNSLALLELVKIEKAKGVSDDKEQSLRRQLKELLIGGVVFSIFLAGFLTIFFILGTTRRLSVLMENTLSLSINRPLRPLVGGTDEIAQLDRVFHAMAQSLEEASRKERAVVDNAQDVICLIDSGYKFAKVNPACARVWGYEPSDLIGKRLAEIILTQDLESTLGALTAMKTGGNSIAFENRIKSKLGNVVWTAWSVYWSSGEDALFCVAHDITDRKLSEARIRALIDNMPVGLVAIDDSGNLEFFNPKAEELFGCPEEELIGTSLLRLLSIETVSEDESFLDKLRSDVSSGSVNEYHCLLRSGEKIYVELSLRQFETAVGKRNLVSVHDVSERHRVEELKQEFVSMITHDLRTPLASIQFTLELLSKKESTNLSEQWINRLASTQGSCTRLIGLINNLLDLEKLRSGKLDLGLEERPLNDIIERSLDSVRGFAEQQKVELQAPHTSAAVLADSERIVQVLVNLLSNAVKFSPSGQTVSVEASPVDSFVEVRVVDHGRGIPASKISEIFDRFAQVSRADAHVKGGGSGLGLTICKAIVEGHGGTIGVSSQEGNGSTFWFRIPRA